MWRIFFLEITTKKFKTDRLRLPAVSKLIHFKLLDICTVTYQYHLPPSPPHLSSSPSPSLLSHPGMSTPDSASEEKTSNKPGWSAENPTKSAPPEKQQEPVPESNLESENKEVRHLTLDFLLAMRHVMRGFICDAQSYLDI